MANTYSQVFLHIIFAVKDRASIIPAIYLPRLHAYLGGVLKKHGHFPYAIGGIENHVHILIGYNINESVPDMIRDLKSTASRYINDNKLIPYHFEWQAGYGCFSYSKSQLDAVCKYIGQQHIHHKSISLEDEIKAILAKFEVEYDERYILKNPE